MKQFRRHATVFMLAYFVAGLAMVGGSHLGVFPPCRLAFICDYTNPHH